MIPVLKAIGISEHEPGVFDKELKSPHQILQGGLVHNVIAASAGVDYGERLSCRLGYPIEELLIDEHGSLLVRLIVGSSIKVSEAFEILSQLLQAKEDTDSDRDLHRRLFFLLKWLIHQELQFRDTVREKVQEQLQFFEQQYVSPSPGEDQDMLQHDIDLFTEGLSVVESEQFDLNELLEHTVYAWETLDRFESVHVNPIRRGPGPMFIPGARYEIVPPI